MSKHSVMSVATMEPNRYVPFLAFLILLCFMERREHDLMENVKQYWNWARWTTDIETSPLFDGSDLSMSGNGEKIAHQGLGVPTGNGGGCVQKGPFKK